MAYSTHIHIFVIDVCWYPKPMPYLFDFNGRLCVYLFYCYNVHPDSIVCHSEKCLPFESIRIN